MTSEPLPPLPDLLSPATPEETIAFNAALALAWPLSHAARNNLPNNFSRKVSSPQTLDIHRMYHWVLTHQPDIVTLNTLAAEALTAQRLRFGQLSLTAAEQLTYERTGERPSTKASKADATAQLLAALGSFKL